MQEDSKYWEVDCGEYGLFKVSEAQMEMILKASAQNVRLVRLDKAVVNIAFIRVMREVNMKPRQLAEPERKPFEPTESGKRLLEDLRDKMRV